MRFAKLRGAQICVDTYFSCGRGPLKTKRDRNFAVPRAFSVVPTSLAVCVCVCVCVCVSGENGVGYRELDRIKMMLFVISRFHFIYLISVVIKILFSIPLLCTVLQLSM